MNTRIIGLALVVTALAALLAPAPTLAQNVVHHDLKVCIVPAEHRISVTDEITLPGAEGDPTERLNFSLHHGLSLEEESRMVVRVNPDSSSRARPGSVAVQPYSMGPGGKVRLSYSGVIHHPLQEGSASARSFSSSPGLIEARGAVLSGSTRWIPRFGDELVTFTLAVDVPAAWDVVSQGKRTRHEVVDGRRHVTWECKAPMDEIYLIAAPFTEYSDKTGEVAAYAFLRQPDPALAARYLETTRQYVDLYSELIGPYPFAKFALVENFWETGYGMPSFTLLGPKVIRFPWILHSSYPHEILHNWWGNSVFVDYARGNWCEGLTAYLADHLIKEGQGQGAAYRRDTLKKYLDFAREGRDFPLAKFRARHSGATEAVGYGKSAMVFHMLRRTLGDRLFTAGLKRLYAEQKFKRASFENVAAAFSAAAGRDLGLFFGPWINRVGAPTLALGRVEVEPRDDRFRVVLELKQTQEEPAYRLWVPVAFTLEGEKEVVWREFAVDAKCALVSADLPARPLRVAVDPMFDLFRKLDRREIPSSIGQLFGAARLTMVVPDADTDPLAAAYRAAAEAWARGIDGKPRIVSASELVQIPGDSAVWVFGADNPWRRAVLEALDGFPFTVGDTSIKLAGTTQATDDHVFVATAKHPSDPDLALGWIRSARADAMPGLTRKLPHYGKYSYLAFRGAEPINSAKGQWGAVGSPLVRDLDPDFDVEIACQPATASPLNTDIPTASLPRRRPLARVKPVFNAARLMAHVSVLADPALEGRGLGTAGIDKAADYIAAQFARAGLKPGGEDGGWFQTWTEPGGPDGKPVQLRNVVGVLPGTKAAWAEQSVVVGAHYDHLGRGWPDVKRGHEGKVHPGADDNASGVAVLIETASRLAAAGRPDRSVVFVAFSGEEWGLKGSRHYVRAAGKYAARQATAMVNVDSVGRLEGRKLMLLGSGSASEWKHIAMGVGFTAGIETTCVPDDLGASDQKAFLEIGVPAIQVFGGAHADYHTSGDTLDKVDAKGVVKAAVFVREAAAYLAGREQPLTSQLKPKPGAAHPGGKAPARSGPGGGRRASLGTMPDFAFRGPGVRVAKVMPGTPAAKAGFREGDVIVEIDGKAVKDLRGYAGVLRAHKAGDRIRVTVERDGEKRALEAVLAAR